MGDAAQFKREAERYRKLAAEESSPVVARRMLDFAEHYEALAALMGEVPPRPSGSSSCCSSSCCNRSWSPTRTKPHPSAFVVAPDGSGSERKRDGGAACRT